MTVGMRTILVHIINDVPIQNFNQWISKRLMKSLIKLIHREYIGSFLMYSIEDWCKGLFIWYENLDCKHVFVPIDC
jgi:hypothetical protein